MSDPRADRAHELRDAGWSLRDIGADLGLSHTAVATLLKEPRDGGTVTTTTSDSEPYWQRVNRRVSPRLSSHTTAPAMALRALTSTLAAVGLADPLPEVAALLADMRRVELGWRATVSAAEARARDAEASVAAGTSTIDMAGASLAGVGDLPHLQRVAERAYGQLLRRAHEAARGDALDVHAGLARVAESAIDVWARAGHVIDDVDAIVADLRAAKTAADRADDRGPGTDAVGRPVAPPPYVAPRYAHLRRLTLADIERDPTRMAAWSVATDAAMVYRRVRDAAELLSTVTGCPPSTVYPDGAVDSYVMRLIGLHVADQVQPAVTAALGWRPGLHLDLRNRAPRAPATDARAGWVAPSSPRGDDAIRGLIVAP